MTDAAQREPPAAEQPPALQRAEAAFARGDHAALQAALAAPGGEQPDAASTRAAELARAVDVDPALTAVLVACLLGLGAVFFHYVLR